MDMTVTNQPQQWQPSFMTQGEKTLSASRTGMALLTNSQQMDVSIMTEEGDKVTLSLESMSAAFSAIHESYNDDGQGTISYEKSEVTMALYQREMTFSVEGDLSEEEREDIQQVMESLDKMMNHLVSGQLSPLTAEAQKFRAWIPLPAWKPACLSNVKPWWPSKVKLRPHITRTDYRIRPSRRRSFCPPKTPRIPNLRMQ